MKADGDVDLATTWSDAVMVQTLSTASKQKPQSVYDDTTEALTIRHLSASSLVATIPQHCNVTVEKPVLEKFAEPGNDRGKGIAIAGKLEGDLSLSTDSDISLEKCRGEKIHLSARTGSINVKTTLEANALRMECATLNGKKIMGDNVAIQFLESVTLSAAYVDQLTIVPVNELEEADYCQAKPSLDGKVTITSMIGNANIQARGDIVVNFEYEGMQLAASTTSTLISETGNIHLTIPDTEPVLVEGSASIFNWQSDDVELVNLVEGEDAGFGTVKLITKGTSTSSRKYHDSQLGSGKINYAYEAEMREHFPELSAGHSSPTRLITVVAPRGEVTLNRTSWRDRITAKLQAK